MKKLIILGTVLLGTAVSLGTTSEKSSAAVTDQDSNVEILNVGDVNDVQDTFSILESKVPIRLDNNWHGLFG